MLFKRHIAFLFAVIYFMTTSGFAITIHYCGGKLEQITTSIENVVCEDEHLEPCCIESEADNDCCSSDTIDIEASDEKVVLNDLDFKIQGVLPHTSKAPHNVPYRRTLKTKLRNITYNSNAPPLYQLYCQYTFYA